MSGARIALLGAVAGFTIFVGLPIGRVRAPMVRVRALQKLEPQTALLALLTLILLLATWLDARTSLESIGGRLHRRCNAAE